MTSDSRKLALRLLFELLEDRKIAIPPELAPSDSKFVAFVSGVEWAVENCRTYIQENSYSGYLTQAESAEALSDVLRPQLWKQLQKSNSPFSVSEE